MVEKIEDEHVGRLEKASPWLLAVRQQFHHSRPELLVDWEAENIRFFVFRTSDSLWIQARYPGGATVAFRAAYCPGVELTLDNPEESSEGAVFHLSSAMGKLCVRIQLPLAGKAFVRWTTSLTPDVDLSLSFYPRDLYVLNENNSPFEVEGIVHASQHGSANATQFLSLTRPRSGTLLYFQNLTALNPYSEQTGVSLAYCLGGSWPELGMRLPVNPERPLPAGQEVVLSDAIVALSTRLPASDPELAMLYLDQLAEIYMLLPRPETAYHSWPDRAAACYQSLRLSEKCTTSIDGQRYMAPYVGATEKPPESMVQLAIQVPLVEYGHWLGRRLDLSDELMEGIKKFYDPDLQALVRFLPGVKFPDGEKEPQEYHNVMDAWYLYHPLHNLARLALLGYDDARSLFFDSLEFGIRVAQHFNYQWPVFYDIETLNVIKAEVAPGEKGESDVGCIYILVMMLAYELSHDERYLAEAEKAAAALSVYGFNLSYETNITAFGISGLWRLYQATHNTQYRDFCYVCLANIFQNVWLWQCNFGYAKSYSTFMGALPLRDAAYLASYEELEILAVFNEFLLMGDQEIRPSALLLMSEFIRYALETSWYDYPVELPAGAISDAVKTGEIDTSLIVPLEDLYEGWQKAGQVGQEVYGTSAVFVYTCRFYVRQEDVPFDIFCDYPFKDIELDRENHRLCLPLMGDERIACRLRLIPGEVIPIDSLRIRVTVEEERKELRGKVTGQGHLEYAPYGNQKVWIEWQG